MATTVYGQGGPRNVLPKDIPNWDMMTDGSRALAQSGGVFQLGGSSGVGSQWEHDNPLLAAGFGTPTAQQTAAAGASMSALNAQQAQGQNLGMGGAGGAMGGTASPYPMSMQQSQPTGYAPPQQAQGAPGPANGGGNPYLGMQGGAIAQTMSDNLNRNFMPQLGMASMATGGYGGSAQGVVQANAMKDMNLGLGSALGNLYGSDWTNSKNRDLSRYQGDQGFYTQQRGQDQSGAALGASLMNQGQQGQWGPINQAAGAYSPFTGLGTTTQNQNQGGGVNGALGGAMAGGILGKYWSGNGNSNMGFGTGKAFGNQDYGQYF